MNSEGNTEVPHKTSRFMELEGLRGLAAVVVVIFHMLVLFYPMMYYGSVVSPIQHSRFEDNLHGTPLMAFMSGTLSVSIFFVLSGFVLSIGYFQTKKMEVLKKIATKRYLRLMLPAVASVMFAWLLISLGASSTAEANSITQSAALPINWVLNPSFFQAVYEGVIGVFVEGSTHNYNSVLWTMKYEFIGSFIVFAFLALFGASSKRWILYIALTIGLHNTWFIGIIMGMILADLYSHRHYFFDNIKQWHFYLILTVGITIGAYPNATSVNTLYNYISLPWINHDQNQAIYTAIGAVFIIIAVLNIKTIKAFMSSKSMSKLGGYTYSLYLVHQPLIYTAGTGLFVYLVQFMGYNRSVFLSMLLTVPVIIGVTLLFYKFIELPSMKAATYFEEVYSGKRDFAFKKTVSNVRLYFYQKISGTRRKAMLIIFARNAANDEIE